MKWDTLFIGLVPISKLGYNLCSGWWPTLYQAIRFLEKKKKNNSTWRRGCHGLIEMKRSINVGQFFQDMKQTPNRFISLRLWLLILIALCIYYMCVYTCEGYILV